MTTASAGLLDRIEHDLDAIVDAVQNGVAHRFPYQDREPSTVQATRHVVRYLVEILLDVTECGPGRADDIEQCFRREATVLIGEGLAQQEVVDLLDHTGSLTIAQVWRRGRPGDHASLIELTGHLGNLLDVVRRTVLDLYWTQARSDRFGRRDRRSLAHALLTGHVPAEVAAAVGVATDVPYRAVVLQSASPEGWRADISDRLTEQRVVHAVLAREVVLFEPAHPPGRLSPGNRLRLGPVAAGTATPTTVADLPDAVAEARLVAAVALTVPVLDTVVTAQQFPLELTLLQDPALTLSMSAVAEPVAARPELLDTIRALYALDLNRTSTARRLGIARRTLTSRLGRIHELTGLDPTSTRGIQVLHTGLTALAMRDAARTASGA